MSNVAAEEQSSKAAWYVPAGIAATLALGLIASTLVASPSPDKAFAKPANTTLEVLATPRNWSPLVEVPAEEEPVAETSSETYAEPSDSGEYYESYDYSSSSESSDTSSYTDTSTTYTDASAGAEEEAWADPLAYEEEIWAEPVSEEAWSDPVVTDSSEIEPFE